MSALYKLFPESKAGGFCSIDSTVSFFVRIRALLKPEHRVLDLGAGRGEGLIEDHIPYRKELRSLKGHCAEVVGCDVDPIVLTNPGLDRAFVIGPDGRLDLPDESIDVVICDWVLEHIENPQAFVAELSRVLRKGGWFCARTPNRWGYISLAARLIPERLHQLVLSKVQPNRKIADVFPAYYRMNSMGDLNSAFSAEKWENCSHTWDSQPAYAGNSVGLWRLTMLMTKLLPRAMGSILMIYVQKKA